ncbi:MAG: universal stress protein [Nitrospirota bacterium]|nr:universal stress protein [Nitrospirota bacterium]
MTIQCPVPKILLPVDGSDNSMRAVEFTGCLGRLMGKSLSRIALLYVMPGSYLGKHSDYKDFRSEIVKQSDIIRKIREQHIEKEIRPFLDNAQKVLKDEGIGIRIEELVSDGDPAAEIIRIAGEGDYTTIMMARKKHKAAKDFLTDVTNHVVHAAGRHTVYVVGLEVLKGTTCPVPKILVPVDGSSYSLNGVEHAACLAGTFREVISGITLIKVIDTTRLENKEEMEKEARHILDEARNMVLLSGIKEGLVTTMIQEGRPAEEIIREADSGNYNLVIMGRKGRSAIKDLILGGVSTTVLQQCVNPVIAVVSS